MADKAPGRHFREGITLLELGEMFPDEEAARVWFEAQVWPTGRACPRCASTRTVETPADTMPYRCQDCRKAKRKDKFSVKTGTALERSKVPLRKWAFAIYLESTSLKGVSSMKLHRDLGVTQKTSWFMQHRLREAWNRTGDERFAGPVEVDESYFGGRERNKHARKRLKLGRGPVGKTAVVGVKDRQTGEVKASVVSHTDGATLQSFIREHVNPGAVLYTDEALAYKGMPEFTHEAVKHSVGEFVRDMAHTNGIESFWATLKRAHKGVYHKISPKHLQRYINEFAGRHCTRDDDTRDQMTGVVTGLVGKRLMYRDLIA